MKSAGTVLACLAVIVVVIVQPELWPILAAAVVAWYVEKYLK